VLVKATTGEQLQRIYEYNEQSGKNYYGNFSFYKTSLVMRELELMKNILVMDFQNFMDRMFRLKTRPTHHTVITCLP
jgi:hypothetical protein